jgi:hypothetical protein
MRTRFLRRPSAATVIALIALFVAIGGTAGAATKLIITGANVKNHSLTGADVKNGSLTGTQIKKGSLTGKQIKNGSLTGTQIKNDSLTGKQINESSLATVPSAANANTVGGKSPGSFAPAGKWALIGGNATGANVLAQSGGFGTVTRAGTGFYLVDAGANITGKPLTATISLSGGFAQVDVAPCGGNANNPGGINCPLFNDNHHVEVRTINAAGTAAADATFYLVIGG